MTDNRPISSLDIESILFASEHPVTVDELVKFFNKEDQELAIEPELIQAHLIELVAKYRSEIYPFEIKYIANGYQFFSKAEYHEHISKFQAHKAKKKLSRTALETLAIIAYRQPVTKQDIERIRGVNSDYSVHKLLEKELINIQGKKDSPGQPLLYGVSEQFMIHFGLENLEHLPKIEDLKIIDELDIFENNQVESTRPEAEEE